MTKIIPFLESSDPVAVADNVIVFAKDVAGVTQLFARASDGTISQITPLALESPAIIAFGDLSIAAGADTRYLDQWGSTVDTAGTTDIRPIVTPRAGTLRNLFVRHNALVGNGNSVVYTVLINGVASAITCTLATGAIGQASDLVNTAAVVQGDLISLQAVKALSIGNGSIIPAVSLEIALV